MDSLIRLAASMDWPFTVAAVGAIGIPLSVFFASRGTTQRMRITADRDRDIERIKVSVRNGLVEQ